ncbi:MAG TPA: nuclease-related domain-containing protein [Ferrovibrio sp.]|uniref:nuclease-related domain-containing protein n=1 Tax=Ferrovibrio sp. TaxID=1917215 RepID=UPI002ED28499
MASFYPPVRPDFFRERSRDAERQVWDILEQMDATWHVFYSVRESNASGFNREIDYVLIRYNRIFYIEVKGGFVEVTQPAGAGVLWPRTTRAGAKLKPVDPTQLWSAKKGVCRTIAQIAGASPAELGYLEHEFYIFPHTSRAVTKGQNLERRNVHYAFAEDMPRLPEKLQEIVASETGRFVPQKRIEAIIASLGSMAVKVGGPRLDQQHLTHPDRSLPAAISPAVVESRLRAARWSSGRGYRRWTRVAITAFLLSLALWYLLPTQPTIPPQPKQRHPERQQASRQNSEQKQKTIQNSERSGADRSRLSHADDEPGKLGSWPTFIPAGAIPAVEVAFSYAIELDKSVPWHTGSMYGFATLQVVEDNGCRRYRITRNDTEPIGLDFIRRCP